MPDCTIEFLEDEITGRTKLVNTSFFFPHRLINTAPHCTKITFRKLLIGSPDEQVFFWIKSVHPF
jgi:hypothetical protein